MALRCGVAVALLLALVMLGTFAPAVAQETAAGAILKTPGAGQASGVDEPDQDAVTSEQAQSLISSLGGATFAERERAMGEILRRGGAMVPHLRQAIEQAEDPELVLRATITLGQMTEDDLEAQITSFLAGGADSGDQGRQWFEGWAAAAQGLGDTPAVRELFIQIMRSHPEVTRSLDGNTAQRAAAAKRVAVSVQMGMMERHQVPTLADGVAMLLPLSDPAVQIDAGYESTLMSVFNRHVGTLRTDAQLWPPVSALLDQWVLRSRPENRADVLWYAMQWDLPAAAQLAKQTLEQTTNIELIQTAVQAITRFGSAEDATALVKLLDDHRPAVTRMPVTHENQPLQVTVADAALAAIAILHKIPPEELGMRAMRLHPKVGFLVDHAGYTADQTEQRAAAMEKARRWTSGHPPAGQPQP